MPSEVHDLNTRSAGQSITVFTQLCSGAIVTQVGSGCLHSDYISHVVLSMLAAFNAVRLEVMLMPQHEISALRL